MPFEQHVPEGWVYPKCYGCGHNYFERPAQPPRPDGSCPDGGLCEWCREEEADLD